MFQVTLHQTCTLTMACRPMMYTSLYRPVDEPPPNNTALLWTTLVKENWEHGGGLVPVVGGELHTPAQDRQRHSTGGLRSTVLNTEVQYSHQNHPPKFNWPDRDTMVCTGG